MTILRITLDDFTKMGNKDLYTPCPNIQKKNILVKKQLQQSLINDKQQISSSGFQQANDSTNVLEEGIKTRQTKLDSTSVQC